MASRVFFAGSYISLWHLKQKTRISASKTTTHAAQNSVKFGMCITMEKSGYHDQGFI